MPSHDPIERVQIARLAAHVSWVNTADPTARTAPARRASELRFKREVDPNGALPPDVRAKRAEHARSAHMIRMARQSVAARRRKARNVAAADTATAAEIEQKSA